MRLSARGRRRLLVGLACCSILAVIATAVVVGRLAHRRGMIDDRRVAGIEARDAGDYGMAIEHLASVVVARPDDVESLIALADGYARHVDGTPADLLRAEELYQAASRVDSRNVDALRGRLSVAARLGDRNRFQQAADRLVAINPASVDGLAALLRLALEDERIEDIAEYAAALAEVDTAQIAWRTVQADAILAQGASTDVLLASVDGWFESAPADGRDQLVKAHVLVRAGQIERARESALRSAGAGARAPEVLRAVLTMLSDLGLRSHVSGAIAAARAVDPTAAWVTDEAIRHAWQTGRISDARAALDSWSGARPASLLRWDAILAGVQGDEAGVEAALGGLREAAAGEALAEGWTHAVEGLVARGHGDLGAAIKEYRRANDRLDRTDPIVLYLLADAYREAGDIDLAIASLRRAGSSIDSGGRSMSSSQR